MEQKEFIQKVIAQKKDILLAASDQIYDFAELAFEEVRSAALLEEILQQEGFTVETGLADIPTAFSGTWGTGSPVIGFLGEYDALDGLSQKAGCWVHTPVKEGAPGHGCGHCLLGSAALGAAIAVKEYLQQNNEKGTVICFGCPAEEGAGSKQFMARDGIFDVCDYVFTWHPAMTNDVSANSTTAIMGANFSFRGKAAHAGGSPWLGRSALDAAELMNVGCNYLHEHMKDGQRVHYAYGDAGGTAPNVVPAYARVKYEVRARTVKECQELFERVTKVAEGAALMTETQMECQITMAFSDFTNNPVLAKVASDTLTELGAPEWSEEDYALARAFLNSYEPLQLSGIKESLKERFGSEKLETILQMPLHDSVIPYDPAKGIPVGGSSDVGDVSYAVPTCEIHVATQCLGNIGHTWQNAGQSASPLGRKGLLRAAEAMALSALRMRDPQLITEAKKATLARNGGKYVCPLPADVKPPIGTY
ncbi:MAG: amidohydrolase [Erysipelotrichaceae bacterium]|nr:amidohydrolase [Erysipelotrichaceae bacterium]